MHVGERNPEGAFLARHNIGPRDGIRHVPDHRPALFSYYRFVLSPDMKNPATRYALRGFDLPEAGDGVRTRDPQLGNLPRERPRAPVSAVSGVQRSWALTSARGRCTTFCTTSLLRGAVVHHRGLVSRRFRSICYLSLRPLNGISACLASTICGIRSLDARRIRRHIPLSREARR